MRANLLWMLACLVILPFAYLASGLVWGIFTSFLAWVGVTAAVEWWIHRGEHEHEGLNYWGGIVAYIAAAILGAALPKMVAALRMTEAEGVAVADVGAHAEADVFVFTDAATASGLDGAARDDIGRKVTAAPLVGASGRPGDPVVAWTITVQDRPSAGDPRIGVRLPPDLEEAGRRAVADAAARHGLRVADRPLLLEPADETPFAVALPPMRQALIMAVALCGMWAVAYVRMR